MGIEVKGEFFELKKELTLNRVDEGGEIGSYIGVFGSQKSIKNFILNEMFDCEFTEEDWNKSEQQIGYTKKELMEMEFEDFIVAVHKYYIVSIQYNSEKYTPGAEYYMLRDY